MIFPKIAFVKVEFLPKESRNILGLVFLLKFQFSGSDNLDDESGEEEGEPMEEDTPAEEKVGT